MIRRRPDHLCEVITNMVSDRSGKGPGVVRLELGDALVAVDPARGGRLTSLRLAGRELLLGPPNATDTSIRWGCFLMAPWAGRLAGGRLHWQGRTYQLRRTHGRHAIHGLVASVPWTVDRSDRESVELSVSLDRDGWPFGGSVRQRVRLEPGRLVLEAEIRADATMPAAIGWHPWFVPREEAAVRVDGDAILEAASMIPTGRLLAATDVLDLRGGRALGRRRLDHAYVGVRPPLEIAWPDLTLRLRTEPWMSTVVVHTPRSGICVEPQSAWPDLGAGTTRLEAGDVLSARLTLEWARRPA